MTGRRIAVVGGGVSGITAGYVLSRTDHVTLFEADDRLGGHADTHPTGVDTGFIVYNERTYPLLTRLFAELGVATQPSQMSMSVRCAGCGLQYAGQRGLPGLAAGLPRGRGRYVRMLAEVPRFHRAAAGSWTTVTTTARSSPIFSERAGSLATSPRISPSPWSPPCGPARPGRRCAIRPGTCSRSWPITGCCRYPGHRRGGP
jgi:phytoene dehydrogenase-like protein